MIAQFTFGGDALRLEERTYNNGRVAVQILTQDGVPYATLSTNLIDQPVGHNCFFVKNYSENVEIAKVCEQFFDVVEGEYGQAGHMQVPVWRIRRWAWCCYINDDVQWVFGSEAKAKAWLAKQPPTSRVVQVRFDR